MSDTIMHDNYTIQTLGNEHIKSATLLFTKCFCDSEPVTKHLGIHYQDYEKFAFEVIQKAAKEGMSKVAIDHQHRVIACAISEDMADPFVPHLAHYPKLKPIIALYDALSAPFVNGKKFINGKIVHVWIAAVDTAYRGQGLSTEIVMACIDTAARKGFDFAYAEFTNAVGQNVTHHFEMLELCNRVRYNDFVYENKKPFEGLEGSADAYVAAIRPGVNLNAITHCYHVAEGTH